MIGRIFIALVAAAVFLAVYITDPSSSIVKASMLAGIALAILFILKSVFTIKL